MKFNFTGTAFTAIIFGAAFDYVQAGHIVACTKNKDGSGPYVETPTHYCCDLTNGAVAAYDEGYGDCRTGVVGGNAIDSGWFAKCCDNEGYGSTGQ